MIIEHVHLNIKMNQSEAFENAFKLAKDIISPMKGLNAVQLIKNTNNEHAYILLIYWNKLEDHTEGFRQSEAYLKWKELLHPFYAPMPEAQYFQPCMMLKLKEPQ
ncbi:antibiotic biosynthesis monooxygenase family protein [Acinetobacter sp. Ver3]|uniref:antibiotic biosynthesis monooxygenase family protein n=1 Tax=Acinetobacter sp. Ver3 TaxID=466088 RepID=UPI00044C9E6C|nr:antibiotic biosynthesis monooxygenase [Acinetobacter sp. Ver3]EZQ07141.1 antibiotic biosynthesis monooxygenase [Acinetobacter sp. Ver3]